MRKQYTYRYRGFEIKPKRDFGPGPGHFIRGQFVKRGWNVVKDFCNAMPAACWFETPKEAREAIDVLLRVKGDATRFWEVMQPFPYKRIGQRADFANGSVRQGRFGAEIKDWRVVSLRDNLTPVL